MSYMIFPEELRVIYIFCREAAMTKFYFEPNYDRFETLLSKIYHFVGLERSIQNIQWKTFDQIAYKVFKSKCQDFVFKMRKIKVK